MWSKVTTILRLHHSSAGTVLGLSSGGSFYQSTKGMDSPRGAGVARDGVSHTSSGNDLIGSPYIGTSLFGEQDDLSIGKSCLYNSNKKKWVCRDCRYTYATNVSEQTQQHTQQRCQVLKRRGKCPPFRTQGWDTPEPRSVSSYDPQSTTGAIRIMTKYGVGKASKVKYEQAQCSLATAAATTNNTYSCFDLARCIAQVPPTLGDQGSNVTSSSGTTRDRMILPMKVYAHGSSSARLIQRISNQSGIPVQHTANPDEACLFFANTKDAVQSTVSPHFHHGQNHFILLTNAGDHPFDKTQFEMAALGMMTIIFYQKYGKVLGDKRPPTPLCR